MLLELAQWLAKDVRLFNVFNYITLRAVLACLTALAVSLILGPYVIRKLTAYKIGQAVRDDGPRSHLTKAGTPTMGGALILVSMCLTTLFWGDLSNRLVWVVLLVTLAFGTVGWIDDYRKVVHRNPRGLPARWKFFWQAVIGLSAAIYLGSLTSSMPALNQLIVPFFKHIAYPLGTVGFIARLFRDRGHLECGEPHRRPRRLGDHADGDGGKRARHLRLRRRPRGIFQVPRPAAYRGGGGARGDLRRDRRRGPRLPLVQRLPRGSLHGRRRRAALGAALGTIAVIVRQEIVLFIMGGVFVAESSR